MKQEKYIDPPFIARTSNFMGLGFRLTADEAQKLLPAGVKAKADENGLVNGGLEIYSTDQVYGVEAYTIAFFTVEATVSENNNAKEGNWVVWGAINNKAALGSFKHFYNLPHRYVSNISLETDGAVHKAKIGEGAQGFELTLKKDPAKPVKATGKAVLLNRTADNQFISVDIPWLAEGAQADVVSLRFNAGNDAVLKILQQANVIYSQVSSNAFSYAKSTK